MMKRIVGSFMFLSTAVHAGELPTWQSAIHSGSRHLALFSLLQDRPSGGAAFTTKLAADLGYAHTGAWPSFLRGTYFVRPTLDFDRNINGGIPGETVNIGPYIFRIDDNSRAMSGYLAGVATGGELSLSYARASTITAGIFTSYAHALNDNLSVAVTTASLCGDQYVHNEMWLDMCVRKVTAQRDLSNVEETIAEVGMKKLFASPIGVHQLEWGIASASRSDYDKPSASIGLTSALTGIGALKVAVDVAKRIEGETTRLRRTSISLTRPVFGKSMTFGLSNSESGGGSLFDVDRRDETTHVFVNRRVNKWMVVTGQWSRTASTISAYEDTYATISVQFTGWSGSRD